MCGLLNFDFVFKLTSLLGIAVAVATYYRNSNIERAKWLSSLHEKFYEKDYYKEIRRILDYKSQIPEGGTLNYRDLKDAIKNDTNSEKQEQLVDYLNFFEFIATLKRKGQLDEEEINLVFGYYINNLSEHEFVMDFIKAGGFQSLVSLIEEIKQLRS